MLAGLKNRPVHLRAALDLVQVETGVQVLAVGELLGLGDRLVPVGGEVSDVVVALYGPAAGRAALVLGVEPLLESVAQGVEAIFCTGGDVVAAGWLHSLHMARGRTGVKQG